MARMYSRSAGVARSYRDPKKPTASSSSAVGAPTRTSFCRDRTRRRHIPRGFPVGLNEVRVPVSRFVQSVERGFGELDLLTLGRRNQCLICSFTLEAVDSGGS